MVCNAAAGGYRLARKLYWSPVAWKLFAVAAPFVVAGLGVATDSPWFMVAFWPLVLILMLAHAFVRKSLEVELGVCTRHRRLRSALRGLSVACLVGVVASIPLFAEAYDLASALLWCSFAGLLCLSVVQSFSGAQAISVKQLTEEHAWLARTGSAFRAALPELPR